VNSSDSDEEYLPPTRLKDICLYLSEFCTIPVQIIGHRFICEHMSVVRIVRTKKRRQIGGMISEDFLSSSQNLNLNSTTPSTVAPLQTVL